MEMTLAKLRDDLLCALKKEAGYEDMVCGDINGNYFAGADFAVSKGAHEREVFRLIVLCYPKREQGE